MTATQQFLAGAYTDLGFRDGALMTPSEPLSQHTVADWMERGEWLTLAKSLDIDRIFFVDNNPVVVFARSDNPDPEVLRRLYNRIWCMARPRFLFLATPGELAVYDLARPPVRPGKSLNEEDRRLELVRSAAEVQSKLAAYSRESVESGQVFADKRIEAATCRADGALIRDLGEVRRMLLDAQLPDRFAHALIGRSIFIRYLEDRKVLIPAYFEDVAKADPTWQRMLEAKTDEAWSGSDGSRLLYPRVLRSKSFTYALFRKLAADFNGDMFPYSVEEERAVTATQLKDLSGFLLGDPRHDSLFFFAYRFDVIPIELISAIYEEFYNAEQERGKTNGSHYTPPELVEFVLSQTLTEARLAQSPRILDPACGSGIFLVEAFRRVVRYRNWKQGRRLNQQELRKILREQIIGIDINEAAVRVAAFSLYLAFLSYQNPREINENRKLPNLKYDNAAPNDGSKERYDVLLVSNAFAVSAQGTDVSSKFASGCADVVVGNPPWGTAKREDAKGVEACDVAMEWCRNRKMPIGDRELSQAFIHLSLEQLRDGGVAGLLVSSGIFFKQQEKSQAFRTAWLSKSKLLHVTNFSHLRHLFFKGGGRFAEACAPFASVLFEKTPFSDAEHRFEYWSPKLTAAAERLQAVVLQKTDMRLLGQAEVMRDDRLWKVYWWGSHRDANFIRGLARWPSIIHASDREGNIVVATGSGIKVGGGTGCCAEWLKNALEFPAEAITRYGDLEANVLVGAPSKVARPRELSLFEGSRLIFKQCPMTVGTNPGQIIARLESTSFIVRHSVYSLKLRAPDTWQGEVLLGILWSSLARYYFFLTASSWGTWYDKIGLDELRALPIRIPDDAGLRGRIVSIVNKLRHWQPQEQTLFTNGLSKDEIAKQQKAMESELDEAVFDLYELMPAERDLVHDMCTYGIDLFYNAQKSLAVKAVDFSQWPHCCGTVREIPKEANGLSPYLRGFLDSWNQQLAPEGEFNWRVVRPTDRTFLLAVCFTTQVRGAKPTPPEPGADAAWNEVLARIDEIALTPYGSRRIFIDGLIRSVSERQITIIKRDERRLWTASAGREDAEATLHQAIRMQELRRP